jgi:putative protease
MSERKRVGKVTHYFSKIRVAGVRVTDRLAIGDQVLIIGHTTALEQAIQSMELDHRPIHVAEAGQEVGIKVIDRVRAGDEVYRLPVAALCENR